MTRIECFARETSAMFIESASWNDKMLSWYKDVTIERFWVDYIKDGIIYDNLDCFNRELSWGAIDELRNTFNEVRDTLWYSGVLKDVYNSNEQYNLDDCYDYLEDITYEMCPECETEVELEMVLKKQICPNCGKVIYPCSICDMDIVNCNECPLDAVCTKQKTEMTWAEYKNYKEDGDTSYVEFDECHDKGDSIISNLRKLLETAQNYNINESAIDNLENALTEVQSFCNNMMDCKCNHYDYYKKNFRK